MKRHRAKNRIRLSYIISLLCFTCALALTGYNLHFIKRAADASKSVMEKLRDIEYIPESDTDENGVPDYITHPNMEMPLREIDGLEYSAVVKIPKLGIELPVIHEYSYERMSLAPCRYYGSIYMDDLVLCAHNHVSHFGRLSTLSTGDSVIVEDMDNNEFDYEVKEIVILDPADVEEFVDSGYDLTLFTCTLDALNRVTVRCDRIE